MTYRDKYPLLLEFENLIRHLFCKIPWCNISHLYYFPEHQFLNRNDHKRIIFVTVFYQVDHCFRSHKPTSSNEKYRKLLTDHACFTEYCEKILQPEFKYGIAVVSQKNHVQVSHKHQSRKKHITSFVSCHGTFPRKNVKQLSRISTMQNGVIPD